MKIGIDLGGSHIGVGLIEEVTLKETSDIFFTEEDSNEAFKLSSEVARILNSIITKLGK